MVDILANRPGRQFGTRTLYIFYLHCNPSVSNDDGEKKMKIDMGWVLITIFLILLFTGIALLGATEKSASYEIILWDGSAKMVTFELCRMSDFGVVSCWNNTNHVQPDYSVQAKSLRRITK